MTRTPLNFSDQELRIIERALDAWAPPVSDYFANNLGRLERSQDIAAARELAKRIRGRY